jgi:hypothetical protein
LSGTQRKKILRIKKDIFAILKELVKHENVSVQKAAATNPGGDDSILEHWESSTFYKLGELEVSLAPETWLLEK